MDTSRSERPVIPCFLNPQSGTAERAASAIEEDERFELRPCEPEELPEMLRAEIEGAAPRVVVAGGDGTIAAAANELIDASVELALLPAGTLNHFATKLGIPEDLKAALEIAAGTATRKVDVGTINDRVLLNTSSVGMYVSFVRLRDYLEQWLGYHLATLASALRVMAHLPTTTVHLDVEEERRSLRTPLAFVGIGERELQFPRLGDRVEGGESKLHVFVVEGKTRGRLLALGFVAAAFGLERAARGPGMERFLVEECTMELPWERAMVAVDGELLPFETPLRYRIRRDALRVVVPAGKA